MLFFSDLSKWLMYDFWYNYIKRKYPKSQLCYSDTDSFIISIFANDIYRDMEQNLHLYDTSDYPKDHFLHSDTNKKVLGRFKDECPGEIIQGKLFKLRFSWYHQKPKLYVLS